MAKNWWFKFEYRIWRTDPNLRRCSFEARAFWLECLCVMYDSDICELEGSYEEIGWLIGCAPEIVARCAVELQRTKTADVTLGNGSVTLTSRRRQRELKVKEQTRLRVQRHREESDVTQSVTIQSKSKSKSKSKNTTTEAVVVVAAATTKKIRPPQLTDEEWLESLKTNPAYQRIEVLDEYARAQVWADANNRQCTRRFFVNWLNRARPMEVNGKQSTKQHNGQYTNRNAAVIEEWREFARQNGG